MELENLRAKTMNDLREIAKAMGIKSVSKYKKDELLILITGNELPEVEDDEETVSDILPGLSAEADDYLDEYEEKYKDDDIVIEEVKTERNESDFVEGFLEITKDFGFLRFKNFLTSDQDVYVPITLVRRFGLRSGDKVKGKVRPPKMDEKYRALIYVDTVNGERVKPNFYRPRFDNLTPEFPTEKYDLSKGSDDSALRIIDLFAPIGKGQRGLICAPPKAGKTILLQKIAKAIRRNHPEVELIVLLIDERPEEVTEMRRSIDADVIYSTFDELPTHHIKVADMVLMRAKALVECGRDVVVLLDSITRLARANNLIIPPSGRTLTGGFDPAAFHKPKKFLGAARNISEGGSLTIIATALIETGSRMDEVIFEEFKGTGNMELTLDRRLAEKRIFPAIDIRRSGTRKEDLLLDKEEMDAIWTIRKKMGNQNAQDLVEKVIEQMNDTKTNQEFVDLIRKANI